ncbi:hypothetical protein HK102_012188 [Quaeritorhiza haematococci]|nr:hypothetical protein HK102_012188 [Quaeritorhiza haematococci]
MGRVTPLSDAAPENPNTKQKPEAACTSQTRRSRRDPTPPAAARAAPRPPAPAGRGAGDERAEGAVDGPPALGRALASPGEAQQLEGGEGVDFQRRAARFAEGGGDPLAAAGEDLDQGRGERRHPHPGQLALQLAAPRARIPAPRAVVVQAAPPPRPGQRRVDGHRPAPPRERRQPEDLGVGRRRGQQLQPPLAQHRHAGLAMLHPRQVDPHAGRGLRPGQGPDRALRRRHAPLFETRDIVDK